MATLEVDQPESLTESGYTIVDIANVNNLNDVFKSLQDSDIFNIIDSITFDDKSQTVIIQMQRLVKREADRVGRQHSVEEDQADAKIVKLSESYKDKYPDLLNHFKEWKPARENLIETLRSAAQNLERNSTYTSCFRILTSAADIFGTLARTGGQGSDSWANFAMEHASTAGVMALFLEMILGKKIHKSVKKAMKEDKELFKKIIQWFEQSEELDTSIKSLFPYGIDPDIVQKIERCSPNFDDYQKIFMSIVASNVKQNVKLFKNKEFLDKAERVATSEVGKQWFHKVVLENDPYLKHRLNTELCGEIQGLLKSIDQELSPTENREMYFDACRALTSKTQMKMTLNAMTIIMAGSNLLFDSQPEATEHLEKLAEMTEKELRQVQKVIRSLKPTELQIDPILE